MKGHVLFNDVAQKHYFYVRDGSVLKNVKQLHQKLFSMHKDVFKHHVNQERNDFHNWVRDVHKDPLADSLRGITTQQEAIDAINTRFKELVQPLQVPKPEERKKSLQKKKEKKNPLVPTAAKTTRRKTRKATRKKATAGKTTRPKKSSSEESKLHPSSITLTPVKQAPTLIIKPIPAPPSLSLWSRAKHAVRDFILVED